MTSPNGPGRENCLPKTETRNVSDGCRADPRRREEARTDCTVVPTPLTIDASLCFPHPWPRRLIFPNPKSGPHRTLCINTYCTYRNNLLLPVLPVLLRVFFIPSEIHVIMILLAWLHVHVAFSRCPLLVQASLLNMHYSYSLQPYTMVRGFIC